MLMRLLGEVAGKAEYACYQQSALYQMDIIIALDAEPVKPDPRPDNKSQSEGTRDEGEENGQPAEIPRIASLPVRKFPVVASQPLVTDGT